MAQCAVQGRVCVLALGTSLWVSLCAAQSQSATTPASTQGTSTATTSTRTTQPQQQQQIAVFQRAVYLSGQVLLEDGSVPPDSVRIERSCGGSVPRTEGYTNADGRFSIQLGLDRSIVSDASLGTSRDGEESRGGTFGSSASRSSGSSPVGMDNRLLGCELRAVLAGYRSVPVNLTGRRVMDKPDVGIIYLTRNIHADTTTSVTSAQAPKDAKKAFDKGSQALGKNKLEDARTQFAKAVELYPQYAAAWYGQGQAFERQNKVEEAKQAYQRCLESDPKYAYPYMQLAEIAHRGQAWQEVAERTDKVIALNPVDFPRAYLLNAAGHMHLRNWDQAERSGREAVRLDPENRMPKARYILGLVLANKGDFGGSSTQLKAYLEMVQATPEAEVVRKQILEVERLASASSAQATPAP